MSDDDALRHRVLWLKAPRRSGLVKIVSYLFGSVAGARRTSGELAAVPVTESTMSHHLTQLRKAGLGAVRATCANVFHRICPRKCGALCAALDLTRT
ncbi:MAG: ArsR family transcriptional regulator [Mycolicibacterium sp.]|nr:ArsR family transcriptional regulator [Mycolicibacterium sp.]